MLRVTVAMSRRIFGVSTAFLGTEIKSVRLGLGLTQVAFAYEIGVAPSTVQKWEEDQTRPSEWAIQKISELCSVKGLLIDHLKSDISNPEPSAAEPIKKAPTATRPKSGISNLRSAAPKQQDLTPEQEERLRRFSNAMVGLQLIYDAAEAGAEGADELLKHLEDQLTARGGDWRRVKYMRLRKDA